LVSHQLGVGGGEFFPVLYEPGEQDQVGAQTLKSENEKRDKNKHSSPIPSLSGVQFTKNLLVDARWHSKTRQASKASEKLKIFWE